MQIDYSATLHMTGNSAKQLTICPLFSEICLGGFVKGIDTVALETALEFGLITIDELAGRLLHIYPTENKNLTAEILKNCL